jgi:hypothetical protein
MGDVMEYNSNKISTFIWYPQILQLCDQNQQKRKHIKEMTIYALILGINLQCPGVSDNSVRKRNQLVVPSC